MIFQRYFLFFSFPFTSKVTNTFEAACIVVFLILCCVVSELDSLAAWWSSGWPSHSFVSSSLMSKGFPRVWPTRSQTCWALRLAFSTATRHACRLGNEHTYRSYQCEIQWIPSLKKLIIQLKKCLNLPKILHRIWSMIELGWADDNRTI